MDLSRKHPGHFCPVKLKNKETAVAGIEHAAGVFMGLFAGKAAEPDQARACEVLIAPSAVFRGAAHGTEARIVKQDY